MYQDKYKFCPTDPTTNSKTANPELSRICEPMNHTFKNFIFALLQTNCSLKLLCLSNIDELILLYFLHSNTDLF